MHVQELALNYLRTRGYCGHWLLPRQSQGLQGTCCVFTQGRVKHIGAVLPGISWPMRKRNLRINAFCPICIVLRYLSQDASEDLGGVGHRHLCNSFSFFPFLCIWSRTPALLDDTSQINCLCASPCPRLGFQERKVRFLKVSYTSRFQKNYLIYLHLFDWLCYT